MRDDQRGSGSNPFAGGGRHRRGTNGTNGAHPEGMRTRPIPLDRFSESAEPVDLVAVQADDELINALAAGMSVSSPGLGGGYDTDDHVAAILAAWKSEVDEEPIPELLDIDTAVAAIVASRPPSRRARRLAPVAAAAAFIVLAIGGLSVGSYSAQPDDALWAVSKVLYSERAESVEAAARVEMHIANAKQALVSGEPELAAQELKQAQADLAAVRPEEGQAELKEVQDFLVAKVMETPPGTPTDPGTPLATQPARPVPTGATVEQQPAVEPAPGPDPSIQGPPAEPAPAGPEVTDPGMDPTADPSTPPPDVVEPTPTENPPPSTDPAPVEPAPNPGETPSSTPQGATEGATFTPTAQGQSETPAAGTDSGAEPSTPN